MSEQDKNTGVVKVEGAELRYVVEGQGRPILVLGSSIYYPRTFSDELKGQFKFAHLDSRHFVPADPDFDITTISLQTYADDAEKARQELGLGKVLVAGHSVHATLALDYARRYPESVSGVVALGGVPGGMGNLQQISQDFWEAEASDERKAILAQNWVEFGGQEKLAELAPSDQIVASYVANGPMYWYDPTFDASPLWEGVESNMSLFFHLMGSMVGEYDLAQGPPPVKSPVFIVMGRYDFVVPHTLWDEAAQAKIPQLSFNLFEKSGHTPQLEEPALFDQKLIAWLGDL